MHHDHDASTIDFANATSELQALREVVVPMEGETVFACVKKRLRNAQRVEDTAEKLVKAIGKRLSDKTVDASTSAVLVGLLDSAGVLDKDGVARIDHPLFFALPKSMQEAALAKSRNHGGGQK